MSAQARGVAIDKADPPEWVRRHVSPAQMRLQRSLLWIVVMYESPTLGKAEINVAQRLHIATEGQDKKERQLSHADLANSTKQSPQTNITAVKKLEAEGWVLVDRVNNRVNRYRLAWPIEDVLSGAKKTVPLCGEPTMKDKTCTRRAGWGTAHQGVGKCVLHEKKEGGDGPAQLQLLESEGRSEESPQLQPLESEGVLAAQTESASTPMVETSDSNHWSPELQPLERPTPTIGALYVGTSGTQKQVRENPGLLAVGEPPLRNARESRPAPPAQPVTSIAARSLIAGIARYRSAPPWARAKHLIPMADAALNAGFGRAAVERYAAMVIAEQRYAEHQHIPELRAALARLGRDHLNGDACPAHGIPECFPCARAEDRPWTEHDQADLEAALDRLGHTTNAPEHETGTA
ncbi:hypothetical protein [Microbispora rosea]|uniref:hypothetical protein n=1 Tax=Microbispora rosea TaxID=58117 RepID=UPI00379C06C1